MPLRPSAVSREQTLIQLSISSIHNRRAPTLCLPWWRYEVGVRGFRLASGPRLATAPTGDGRSRPSTGSRLSTGSQARAEVRARAETQPRFASWSAIGRRRMRVPVSAKMALQTAGAIGGTPGSPMPVKSAPDSMMATSMGGATLMRTSG